MKKVLCIFSLLCMVCTGAWAQADSYAGTWYLQEASTGQFVNVSKVSSWASELHLDATAAATFVVEAINDAYTIKHSGRSNNVGGNSSGHGRMYNDCTNSNNYTFEAVEGGVKIRDAANYYICFDTPANSLYLKNDVAGSVFRLVSADQYANSIVDITYKVTNVSGQEASYTMKALLGEKVVAPFIPFFTGGTVSDDNKTVTAENKIFHVTDGTWTFPFEVGKYYTMKASNSSYNFVYNGTNAYCNNTTAPALDNDKWSFEHVATSLDLFKVKNEKGGYATVANATNQTLVTFSNTLTQWTSGTGATSYFRITRNTTNLERGFNLQHPGNEQANAGNHVSAGLGLWTNASSPNNNGSCMLVTEATLTTLDEYKTGVYAIVDAWPLASQTVKDNAKSAINDAADKAGVNTALANGYVAYNTEISSKYYHIKSAYPGYQTNQHVDKAFIAGDSKVTWGTFDAANPYQYFQITVTTNGYYNIKSYKVNKFMTATNGTLGASATNNTIFTSLGEGQYNIVVGSGNPCHTEGHSEGAGVSGDLVTWPGDANSCSAWKFIETTAQEYEAANAKTINYTITDVAGTQYTGSYRGGRGEMPPFTGVTGQTYQNVVWGEDGDNLTLTANITFPFPVSTATVHNYTYIGIQVNNQKLLYNDNGNVKMSSGVMPNNGNADNYKWEIVPSFSEGAFTFMIKNFSGQYIAGTSTTAAANAFALSNEGTGYAFGDTNINNGRGFYVPSNTNYFLSINSPGGSNQNLFIWNKSGNSHTGSNLGFFAPTDFDALMTKLNQYVIGTGLGKYSTTEENATKIAAVKAGTQYATAADFTAMFRACTFNMPESGKFYRLKATNNRYMCSDPAYGGSNDPEIYSLKVKEGNEKTTIFHLTADGHLIAYATGTSVSWGWKTTLVGADHDCTWTISEAENVIGKYAIQCPPTTTWANLIYIGYNDNTHVTREGSQNGYTAWEIEEVTELPVSLSAVDGHCYGTLYTPVALRLSEEVRAYAVEISEDGTKANMVSVDDVIPANSAVVLYSKSEENTSVSLPIGGDATLDSNALDGVVATQSVDAGTVLTMQNGNTGIGFYNYTGTTLKGFKAYLSKTKTAGVQSFTFNFDDIVTGIQQLENANQNVQTFDLSGRQVSKAQRGLYIINGHKVVR